MTKQYTIPIFVAHLGCPFDCVFCNQNRITGQSTNVRGEDVRKSIEEYLGYFTREAKIEVGFFGGSFTGIDADRQEELLAVAREYKDQGLIDEIRLSTRPDFINESILKRLKEYKVDTIELGVQSLSQEVLDLSGRGHSKEVVYKSAQLIRAFGFNLGLQMMLGLPGDRHDLSLNTVEEFINIRPDCVRIYPTLVIKDTELEKMYREGSYKSLELEEAVARTAAYLIRFEAEDINVIRVGLQATDNIQLGEDVVAGPFHPSFGEMVESHIYRELIDQALEAKNLEATSLILRTNNKNISKLVGQSRSNKDYFFKKYKLKSIGFRADSNLEGKDLIIETESEEIKIDYLKAIKNII